MSLLSSSTKFVSAAIIGGLLLAGCSEGEHHEVHVEDVVDEASQIARANAPEPEVFDFEVDDAAMATTDAATADNAGTETSDTETAEPTATVDATASDSQAATVDVANADMAVAEAQ